MRILPTDFAIQRTENITKKSERREKTALQTPRIWINVDSRANRLLKCFPRQWRSNKNSSLQYYKIISNKNNEFI